MRMENRDNQRPGMKEFEMAWQEFFKDKPEPENDEEERKEQEEFHHWYNYVRKQSDTGKTPAEMYKEVYGKEPLENPTEVSRMMNFGWDDYEEELMDFIYKLQEYDNEEGNKLEYGEVKKKLDPTIKEIIKRGERALGLLHELLENIGTWSCLFALEILQEIKSLKSINPLIELIKNNEYEESWNLWECCEEACKALTAIGKPGIVTLILETEKNFSDKKYYGYIIEGFSNIKDERVYNFLRSVLEDYLRDYSKYRDWFEIGHFICGFHKQENRDVLPLIKELFNKDFLSEDDKIEIKELIEDLENPDLVQKRLEKLKQEYESEFGKRD